MTTPIQAIRGMNDILPTETFLWQHVENILKEVLHSYCYQEIRLPIVEKTELFKRSIGEATDIVEKEMYTFLDRNNDSLTLRPELTAGVVRAGIEHGLLYNQIQRLWYLGPNFRHERPQKGRYRQFYQCGAEVFGIPGPEIDAELILLSARIFKRLNIKNHLTLQLNSLGSMQARLNYREKLVTYLAAHRDQLDEDSQRRLTTNPLRILDSKNPAMQQLIDNAPKLLDHLDSESAEHFAQLQKYLQQNGLEYSINPHLVRGLDYYSKTVFEWVTDALGAQGTVCAGGRYDVLVEQLSGNPTPALGFAIGMERTILLFQETHKNLTAEPFDIFIMTDSSPAYAKALQIADELRDTYRSTPVLVSSGSFKNQFKKADKCGARLALILGEEEMANNTITIKFLRENIPQLTVSQDKLKDRSFLFPI